MRKILLFVVALLFVATNINAEKLTGTLSSNMNAYSTWTDEYPSSNANDGNYSTKFWSDASQEVGDYVTMSLNASASIGEIKFYFSDGDKPAAADHGRFYQKCQPSDGCGALYHQSLPTGTEAGL